MAVLRHEDLAAYIFSIAALCIWIVVQLEGSVSVSVIGRSHEKLLGIADCLQPVFCIVLVGHLRLILKTLSEQISVGVVGEGILLCQIAFPFLRCRHLIVVIVGIADLPGFQIAVKLFLLRKGAVACLVVFVGIRRLVEGSLALLAGQQLPIFVVCKPPLRSFPLWILILPWICGSMDTWIQLSALMAVVLIGRKQTLLCRFFDNQAAIVVGILVIRDEKTADAGILRLQNLISGVVGIDHTRSWFPVHPGLSAW